MTKNKTRVRSGLVVLFLHSKLLRKFTTSLALGWLSYGRSWRSRLKSSWAPCSSMAASAVPDGLPPARSLCCSTVPLLGSLTRCIGFKNKTFQCSCILCTLYFFNSKKSFLKIWQLIVSWIFPLLKSISQFLQEKPSLHDKGVLLKLWTIKSFPTGCIFYYFVDGCICGSRRNTSCQILLWIVKARTFF